MTKTKYPSLNGLRAISVFMVILHHLAIQNKIFEHLPKNKALQLVVQFLRSGQLGVNIFFVISGFLITSLLLQEEKSTGTLSLKNFYVRRTLRIFPAYYFLLLVYFVLQLVHFVQISSMSWLTAITYTKYLNYKLDWVTGHAWSLSIEEQFYLFWPLLFLLGNAQRRSASVFFIVFAAAVRLYTIAHPIWWMNDLSIFARIDAIATGCFIAFHKDFILKFLKPYFGLAFFLSLFGLFFLTSVPYIRNIVDVHLGPLGSSHGTLANIFIGIILLYSVFGSEGLWFKFLNSKPMNYIGMLSYGLYLWQQVFISGPDHWITSFPQNIVFIFAAAMFSYYVIEKPFLKLKDRFQRRRDEKPLASSVQYRAEVESTN